MGEQPVTATLRNMRKYYTDFTVIAYSPTTLATASANPGDYWWLTDEDDPLEDSQGRPMLLGRMPPTPRPLEIHPL